MGTITSNIETVTRTRRGGYRRRGQTGFPARRFQRAARRPGTHYRRRPHQSRPAHHQLSSGRGRAGRHRLPSRPAQGKVRSESSLAPVAKRLARLLEKECPLAPTCTGADTRGMVDEMKAGEVLLLENLRFHPGEEENDEKFAQKLASLADVYIGDAFGNAHRHHASMSAITKFLNPAGGRFSDDQGSELLKRRGEQPDAPRGGDSRRREGERENRHRRAHSPENGQDHHRRRHGGHLPSRAGLPRWETAWSRSTWWTRRARS